MDVKVHVIESTSFKDEHYDIDSTSHCECEGKVEWQHRTFNKSSQQHPKKTVLRPTQLN
jgi:hypothetical protein